MSVNGVNVENVEHAFVIRLLKEAKDFIHLVIRRNLNSNQKSASELAEIAKRRNQAITKTAATVLSNYTGKHAANGNNLDTTSSSNNVNPLNFVISNANFVPSLKPIKVTLNKKDKKDIYGVVLGCQFYIKDILPNSLAASEANLCKGDILVKLNEMASEQLTLLEANKLLTKSKENKINLIVKRNAGSGSSGISSLSNSDDDLIDETNIKPDKVEQHKSQNFLDISNSISIAKPQDSNSEFFKPISVENPETISSNINNNNSTNNRLPKFFSK